MSAINFEDRKHSFRSFYNNIISPDSEKGQTTNDTHAINAALMMSMSGKHQFVANFMNGSKGAGSTNGAKGLYGALREAYKRVGEQRGLHPREVQSIVWEAIRGLFDTKNSNSEVICYVVTKATNKLLPLP